MTVHESEAGEPLAVLQGEGWRPVSVLRGAWTLDQHWWRGQPVRRTYYRLAPADGAPFTVFKDLSTGRWFRQEY